MNKMINPCVPTLHFNGCCYPPTTALPLLLASKRLSEALIAVPQVETTAATMRRRREGVLPKPVAIGLACLALFGLVSGSMLDADSAWCAADGTAPFSDDCFRDAVAEAKSNSSRPFQFFFFSIF